MNELCSHSERALCVDPLNPCEPIGCMYAAFGLHRGLPLSHGASGCCRFQRMEIAKHFDRVVHVPSTMLRDHAAAFGGKAELAEAVGNVFRLYDPDVLVVGTTCMTETMGEDMAGMVAEIEIPEGKRLVWASTPGYSGSHLAGYDATVAAIVRQLGGAAGAAGTPGAAVTPSAAGVPDAAGTSDARGGRGGRLCLIPGWANPCDVDLMARYAEAFFARVTVLPDVRGVFDELPSGDPRAYTPGGTPLDEVETLAGCTAALGLGHDATHLAVAAAEEVVVGQDGSVVPGGQVEPGGADPSRGMRTARCEAFPIGIGLTDAFVAALVELSGAPAPAWLARERTRLVDALARVEAQVFGKRALVCCDADMAVGLAAFARDMGMAPVCVAVGDAEPGFEERLHTAVGGLDGCRVLVGTDRLMVEQAMATAPGGVDLVLGDTRNKRMAARLGAPLVRVGFPVVDRPLSYLQPVACYEGALDLLRRVADALLDHSERGQAPEDLAIHRFF